MKCCWLSCRKIIAPVTICLRSDLFPDSCSHRTMGSAPLSPPPCSPSARCSCRRRPRHPARDINDGDHGDHDDGDHDYAPARRSTPRPTSWAALAWGSDWPSKRYVMMIYIIYFTILIRYNNTLPGRRDSSPSAPQRPESPTCPTLQNICCQSFQKRKRKKWLNCQNNVFFPQL